MPAEFLTDAEAASYGRYNGPPARAELERAFFLDDADKALIAGRRGHHKRLGFSLQLTSVRSLGLFLADPLDVPNSVLEYLADQLDIADPSCVKRYTERRTTRLEHAEEIKGTLGLRGFGEAEQELIAWVEARAWTTGDGPKAIFNDALAWLLKRTCSCPGVTALAWWPRSGTRPTSCSGTRSPSGRRPASGRCWSDSWTFPTGACLLGP